LTKCILVFDEFEKCFNLLKIFQEKSIPLSKATVITPLNDQINSRDKELVHEGKQMGELSSIEQIRILNPKLDRRIRQTSMRNWLMPFGFIAGLTFSNMTNLSTFAFLGLNNIGETIMGGCLGMFSGLLGSIVASGSINLNRNKEIRPILKTHKEGKWLILLENQIGSELPWFLIKESGSEDIFFIQD